MTKVYEGTKTVQLNGWEKVALATGIEKMLERGELNEAQGRALLKKIDDCFFVSVKILKSKL